MLFRGLIVVGLAVMTTAALANGAISEFPAGGVVFKQSADIAIDREDLFISLREIRVHYDYRSEAAATQTVTIGFPMPPVPLDDSPDYLGGGGYYLEEVDDLRNYMAFSAEVNGKPVETILHEYAQLETGEDVSERLRGLGVPLFLTADVAQQKLSALDRTILDTLVADGLVAEDTTGGYLVPLWLYQTVYEWTQDFAPGVTKVDISYAPLFGAPGDFGDTYEVGEVADLYCVDDAVRAEIARRSDAGDLYSEVSTIGYIVETARYWNGPIGQFTLTVDDADPAMEAEGYAKDVITAFCPAGVTKNTDGLYQWRARDFVPDHDIRVVFFSYYRGDIGNEDTGTAEGEGGT